MVRIIKIHKNDSGQRIDKFLRKLLDKASLSFIFKMMRTNQVKLNHKKTKPEIILNEDDEIRIYLDEEKLKLFSRVLFQGEHRPKEFALQDAILYQDKDILALNKPPNVIVHHGGRFSYQDTMIYKIHEYFSDNSLTFKPSFVHRLDRETSGVILVALSMHALQELGRQIKAHETTKKYITLVKGTIKKKEGTIDAPIYKYQSDNRYHNVEVRNHPDAKSAVTHYKILKYFDNCTLCEVTLETGRMHQIRLHMHHLGHPVIGDDLYGDKSLNKLFLQKYNLNRQFLHSSSMTITHPTTGKKVTIEAPLSNDLLFVNK